MTHKNSRFSFRRSFLCVMDCFHTCPDDLIQHLLSYLSTPSVVTLGLTCTQMRNLASSKVRPPLTPLCSLTSQLITIPRSATFFSLCAKEGSIPLLQWCLDMGLHWEAESLLNAARVGDLSVLQWLIDSGCDWHVKAASEVFVAGLPAEERNKEE